MMESSSVMDSQVTNEWVESVDTKSIQRALLDEQASRHAKKRKTKQRQVFMLLRLLAFLCISPIAGLLIYLIVRGAPAVNWTFLTSPPLENMCAGGIKPAIWGTMLLVSYALLFALPIGVFGAIYLNEYARQGRWTRTIRLAIINLAGVPSIVFGLFGLGIFVLTIGPWFADPNLFGWHFHPKIGSHVLNMGFGASIIAGSMTLAILVLPLIITSTEEALKTVPRSFREASLALGGTKWQTIRRVTLPNALPGIMTGIVLAIGRAAGETAPILLTVAVLYQASSPAWYQVTSPTMALPYHLYIISTQATSVPDTFQWGTAFVLLMVVLAFNAIAIIIRARFRAKQNW
jgi:phosphate transport system permease protein